MPVFLTSRAHRQTASLGARVQPSPTSPRPRRQDAGRTFLRAAHRRAGCAGDGL